MDKIQELKIFHVLIYLNVLVKKLKNIFIYLII